MIIKWGDEPEYLGRMYNTVSRRMGKVERNKETRSRTSARDVSHTISPNFTLSADEIVVIWYANDEQIPAVRHSRLDWDSHDVFWVLALNGSGWL